jgi:hypothetical protein
MQKTTKKLIEEAKAQYDSVGSVYCKPIRSQVIFGKHGWNHLLKDGHGHRRADMDLRNRLIIINFAPEIIRNAISATQEIVEIDIAGKKVPVTYTHVQGIVGHNYACVVIRKFPDGSPHYYSIWDLKKKIRRKIKKP